MLMSDELYAQLKEKTIELELTGSRAICSVVSESSDTDYLVLIEQNNIPFLYSLGFKDCSELQYEEENWVILRNKDNINLIITSDEDLYSIWSSCTNLAKRLKMEEKTKRVDFFRYIFNLYYEKN